MRIRLVILAFVAGASLSGLTACTHDTARTALAVTHPRWTRTGELRLSTECADDIELTAEPDPKDPTIMQVQVWGRPMLGRCNPLAPFPFDVPGSVEKILDETTSQIIDLPKRPGL